MTDDQSLSPEALLAERISKALAEAGLIRTEDADRVRDALASGEARQDDWHFWIEQQHAAGEREDTNGQAE